MTTQTPICTKYSGRKDVDPVKTKPSKNFSVQEMITLMDPNQQYQAALIYPGLFLSLVGFVMKHSLQFMSIHCSVNVVMSMPLEVDTHYRETLLYIRKFFVVKKFSWS